MALPSNTPILQKLIDKFSNSRDFTISFALHAILVAVFGGSVIFQAVQEPGDFEGGSGEFVQGGEASTPPAPTPQVPQETTFSVTTAPAPADTAPLSAITTTMPNALNFAASTSVTQVMTAAPTTVTPPAPPVTRNTAVGSDAMPTGAASGIKGFSQGWGKASGSGTGLKSREFEFTAFIGQYQGGNWDSTIRVTKGKIETGSLPNLLYLMSTWSKDKIKTNYKNVQAIKLDSDQLFSIKPPFIFMTGTRDFKLTDKEVENLQKYVRLGGCIWGDSSVPGQRSRFDIAFRREMKRVIPDVDKKFEPLPANHEIYTNTYFTEVKEVPAGLNFYREPVYAMKIYGEIAVLYTANDYGDMWQFGLNAQGQIDLRQDANRAYIAINPQLWANRGVYLRNIDPTALATSFKFGTNIVIHLLTRWEDKVRTAPTL